MSEFAPTDPSQWNYTLNAEQVAELRRSANTGTRRHIIGRDKDVLNGQYGGAYGGESIVVDYDRNREYFDSLADTVVESCKNKAGRIDKSRVLDSVFGLVSDLMPYSQEAVDRVNSRLNLGDNRKVSLSLYSSENAGVCRHQALLVKTILEILENKKIIRGKSSIDRSIQWPERGDEGGHAWVRYTNSAGEVYILDVAQKFIGTLDESTKRDRGWNYLRPEEIVARKNIGKTSFDADGLIVFPKDW